MSDRWVIVGLGNPGQEYEKTRHNIGFMAIHDLASSYGIKAQQEKKFKAMVGNGTIEGHAVLLVQPLTYMNLSGESVGPILQYYKVAPERLLVIYDDAALPVGKIRVRADGSAGGQKGMKSIIQHLSGVEQFPRLRIGIGAPQGQRDMADHVLSRFTAEEMDWMERYILPETQRAVGIILNDGVERAATRVNGLNLLPQPPAPAPTPQANPNGVPDPLPSPFE